METINVTEFAKSRAQHHEGNGKDGAFARGAKNGLAATEEIPLRVREIAMMRGLGFSFREIGGEFGISPQAVSLMLSRHRRAAKSLGPDSPFRGLSSRAVNVLGRHAIRTRDDARARNIVAVLPQERNCGKKTAEEIERWLAAGSH